MGSCITSGNNPKAVIKNKVGKSTTLKTSREQEEKYKDLEEWEGDRYTGNGIKRLKSYICNLAIDELKEMRLDFWKIKIAENENWKYIKHALSLDSCKKNFNLAYCENFLKSKNIFLIHDCVNRLRDSNNNIYKIPNFIINDPHFEKQLKNEEEYTKKENLKLILYELYNNKKTSVEVMYNTTIKELKLKYSELDQFNLNEYKIKFLFGGSELKDEHFVYEYNIMDEYTIQVLKTKINNDC